MDEIWSPSPVVVNPGRKFPVLPNVADIGPGGSVTSFQVYQTSAVTHHNLKHFPFDSQRFAIEIITPEYDENKVQFVLDEKFTGREDTLNISDWLVGDVNGMIKTKEVKALGGSHSSLVFEILADRVGVFYVWKVILPLCLIVAMSWCVFWINPAQFGPQIGLSATSMLTLIAFIFATTNMLPRLGYFTTLDLFIGASLILVFLALLQSLVTSYLVSMQKAELAGRIDRICRVMFPAAFVIMALIVFRESL